MPIIPPDLREKPRSPVNSDVWAQATPATGALPMIELILAAATLLGGAAAAWYFYDKWSGKTPRPITEGDLTNLEAQAFAL
jgi:hypothetical protein